MLFHTGSLCRLNELGWLPRLDVVSAVSGGALVAGVLAHAWTRLRFVDDVAENFDELIVTPLCGLADRGLDISTALRGMLWPGRSVGEVLARVYRRRLFGEFMLAELPRRPEFVFTATNLQNGSLWRFSHRYMADYQYGGVRDPREPLATAVAASSAFPPFLSPVVMPMPVWDIDGARPDEGGPTVTDRPSTVVLSDGGVYDNQGLDPVIHRCATVLVSNGGQWLKRTERVPRNWIRHLLRVFDTVDNQVRSLRANALKESYLDGEFAGARWSTYSDLADYGVADALPAPPEQTGRLAELPTRLSRMPRETQRRLINWGYAACDAAMRRYVVPGAAAPVGFPYPAEGVG